MKTINEIKQDIKGKYEMAKINAYWRFKHTVDWCAENPMLAICIISALSGIVSSGAKVATHAIDARRVDKENKNKDYIYDRSTDAYYKLKHGPLSAQEALMVAELREHGYSKVEALDELGLIK